MKEKLIRQGSSCSFLENYTLSLYTVYNKQGTLCTAVTCNGLVVEMLM